MTVRLPYPNHHPPTFGSLMQAMGTFINTRAEVGEDDDGQLIIHTNLKEEGNHLVDMGPYPEEIKETIECDVCCEEIRPNDDLFTYIGKEHNWHTCSSECQKKVMSLD